MAEQDRYGGWFGGNRAEQIKEKIQNAIPKLPVLNKIFTIAHLAGISSLLLTE